MRKVILYLSFCFLFCLAPYASAQESKAPRIKYFSSEISNSPIHISLDEGQRPKSYSTLNYTINSEKDQKLKYLFFEVLVFSSHAELLWVDRSVDSKFSGQGPVRHGKLHIKDLDRAEFIYVILDKIVIPGGVWRVNVEKLDEKLRTSGLVAVKDVSFNYEDDLELTIADRQEVLQTVLQSLSEDKKKRESLEDKPLMIAVDDHDFFPLRSPNVLQLTRRQIIQLVEGKERTPFLVCRPIEVEGNRVRVRLFVDHAYPTYPVVVSSGGLVFFYELGKSNGRWYILDTSSIYAVG